MRKKSRKKQYSSFVGVQTSVTRLRDAAKAVKRSRSRYAAYAFLAEVYQCYWEWLDRGWADKHIKSLKRQLGLTQCGIQQPLKTLILAANYSLEAKLRSRWIRALEYALSQDMEPDDLLRLFRHYGGIAGAARHAAKTEPKRGPPPDAWA